MRDIPKTGVIALMCMGLATGYGNADALRVRAQAREAAGVHGMPSLDGSPPRQSSVTLPNLARPALEDNPIHRFVSIPLLFAGDAYNVPAPQPALPSRSNHTAPSGTPTAGTGGQGAAHTPAPQATADSANGQNAITVKAAIQSAHYDSPPHAPGSVADPLAQVTEATARGIWYTGPQGTAAGLASVLSSLHDRASRLSSLGLERVLDHQTFVSGVTLPVSSRQDDPSGDAGLSAQRLPMASGLKLQGVHPLATAYLQAEAAQATAVPTATAQPTATPTADSLTHAGLVQQASPTPAPTVPATRTAATMPGGNAQVYYVTGYTWTGYRTATGTIPHYGVVAVDPRVIPLGATVYIQGLGVFHAEDTGGFIIGKRVDVFANSDAEANQLTGYKLVSWTM